MQILKKISKSFGRWKIITIYYIFDYFIVFKNNLILKIDPNKYIDKVNLTLVFFVNNLQDPVLFSGTIRTNLDPLEKYNDGEMWQALQSSYLKDYIKSLPGELYFVCGEGGENFRWGS